MSSGRPEREEDLEHRASHFTVGRPVGGRGEVSCGLAMAASLLRRALLLLIRWFLLGVCALVALTLLLGEFPLFSPGFGLMLVGVPLAVVLLYVVLSRWLAAPEWEDLAAGLPWVLWGWLPIPLAMLVLEPWALITVTNWSMPSSYDYVPHPILRVTLGLYLFVTALALAAGRPSVPRVLLRLVGPWVIFLGALVLFFSLSPKPVFLG